MDVLRELVRDPFVMGRITANHALSDIYAMGAKPFTAQAFVSLPFGHERVQERDLRYLMAGAIQEFDTADCRLVGGHSLEGSELNFGFSVTGIATDKPLLLKEGLRCGDHLILCKPIGTGVLYAAQRKHSVDGRWLVAAEQMMLCSNAEAAEIAQDYSASACTDITGFGLLGHLSEMLTLSQLGVILNLNSLPMLPGVLECMAMGMESTMYEANKRIESLVENREEFRGRVSYPALFDPQTSGGLLFAVNPQNSDNCVRSLRARGYCQAAVIGKVTEGSILLE
jgi:selenide,water dikinase